MYKLEGVRYWDGSVSLQNRPVPLESRNGNGHNTEGSTTSVAVTPGGKENRG